MRDTYFLVKIRYLLADKIISLMGKSRKRKLMGGGMTSNIMTGNLYINGLIQSNSIQVKKLQPNTPPQIGVEDDPSNPLMSSQKKDMATNSHENVSVGDRFADKMLERCQKEIAKRSPSKQDMSSAALMSNALLETAKEIGNIFGKEAANNFMALILSTTDDKVDETRLVSAIQSFFSGIESSMERTDGFSGFSRVGGFSAVLNKGCKLLAQLEDDTDVLQNSDADLGLAYAMNLFFETFAVDNFGPAFKTFDLNFNWEISSAKPVDMGSSETVTASSLSKSETAEGVADYLLNAIGNEKAAKYISELPRGANFIEAIGTAISIVLMENGQRQAELFVLYLNNNIKNDVNATHSGDTFHGWRLGRDESKPYDGLGREQFEENDFFLGSSEVSRKGHIGLSMKWTVDSNGIGCFRTIDMNEAYAQYSRMQEMQEIQASKADFEAAINEPKGNLLDSYI
ncbi:MAG: hypothetical protein ACRCTY_08980 [Candidatus Adiutrix sp.]